MAAYIGNYGITSVQLDYIDDIFHQIDGRYIEAKGYTYKSSVDLTISNVNDLDYMGSMEDEEGFLNMAQNTVYQYSRPLDGTMQDGSINLKIDNSVYHGNISVMEGYPDAENLIYTEDRQVAFLCCKLGDQAQFLLLSCYDLMTDIDFSITLSGEADVVVPLDLKFMPYSVNGGSANSCSEAFNIDNIATGQYSHAEGNRTIAAGIQSHAEGYHTNAYGQASHTEGYNTTANGSFSHAEGRGTNASSSNQHVEGIYNIIDEDDTYLHITGRGTDSSHRANAFTVDTKGNG